MASPCKLPISREQPALASDNPLSIAFIGFGEVGQTFATGLLASGGVRITAFDLLFGQTQHQTVAGKASALGVEVRPDAASAARAAHLVISAVTADAAEDVARCAAGYLTPGQYFLDVNSASPDTKRRAAGYINAVGAHYVEGAVMAPVLKPGISVPILSGGPEAENLSRKLNALGMNLTPVATDYGRASAMKLCRSIMIKGLEVLMVDCAASSAHWNVQNEVFASLSETFPSIDWPALSINMQERVATHGIRRSAEMREAAEMMAALGRDQSLVAAVADAQARGARPKP
jgi:3-hydroxyisobutyrate dehydrogenase-like beta-hydroxyacid dehydrogenase